MDAAYEFRPLEHSKMLGDGLPREPGAARELRNRSGLPAAKLRNQCQPSLVAERGEDDCGSPAFGGRNAKVFARHSSQYSSFAASNRRRSCGMLRRDGRLELS